MKSAQLGPWVKGITNVVPAYSLPKDSLVDAVNVDIDRAGVVTTRTAWQRADIAPSSSLFEHGGTTYGVVGGSVGALTAEGFTPIATAGTHVSWTVVEGAPTFSDGVGIYRITGLVAESLYAGIGEDEAELMLAPLPGGQSISCWQGRLVVARGNSLFFSEPFRYGVYDTLRSYITFEERIRWVAPLREGVYVGLRGSVVFLRGSFPEFTLLRVADQSWSGSGTTVSAAGMTKEVVGDSEYVVAWMCSRGFALGLPDGSVMYPQQDRIKEIPEQSGSVVVLGDRITVLPN
jgi:hypothetical protein